jgi:hypothetical protein
MRRALLLPALLCCAAALGGEEALTSAYFPMQVGAKWEFQSPAGKNTSEIAGIDTVRGVECAKVQTTFGENVSFEHIGISPAGICRLDYGINQLEPAVLLLKLNPKAGDKWDIVLTMDNEKCKGISTVTEEDVKVPAGTFHALCVTTIVESKGSIATTKLWYVKGVGMVKQFALFGTQQITNELIRYTPGGKR